MRETVQVGLLVRVQLQGVGDGVDDFGGDVVGEALL
jgi:hypothetical protein